MAARGERWQVMAVWKGRDWEQARERREAVRSLRLMGQGPLAWGQHEMQRKLGKARGSATCPWVPP